MISIAMNYLNRRRIIILSIVVFLLALIFVFKVFRKESLQSPDNSQLNDLSDFSAIKVVPREEFSLKDYFPKNETIFLGVPTGEKIEVKNFYQLASDTEEGLFIIKETNDYSLIYDNVNKVFYIIFLSDEISTNILEKAEGEFVKILGIKNRNDACKLKVHLQTLKDYNNTSLNFLKLSFCR